MSATGLSAEDNKKSFQRRSDSSRRGASKLLFYPDSAWTVPGPLFRYNMYLRLPIEEYDVDENAGVGAWVLLEPIALPAAQDQHVGVRRSGRTLTPNVRNIDQS